MSGHENEAAEVRYSTIPLGKHQHVSAMVSFRQDWKQVVFEKGVLSSEEPIAIKLVWVGDG